MALATMAGIALVLSLALAGKARSQDLPDPCPVPSAALAETPDDLAKVQADIDRFNLCVERAQLLKRLNELAVENEKAAVAPSRNNPGMRLDADRLPDTAGSLPRSPVTPLAPLPTTGGPKGPGDDWTIVEVFGATGSLTAKLVRQDGAVQYASQGAVLPDGRRITVITSTSVILEKDGKTTELQWLE